MSRVADPTPFGLICVNPPPSAVGLPAARVADPTPFGLICVNPPPSAVGLPAARVADPTLFGLIGINPPPSAGGRNALSINGDCRNEDSGRHRQRQDREKDGQQFHAHKFPPQEAIFDFSQDRNGDSISPTTNLLVSCRARVLRMPYLVPKDLHHVVAAVRIANGRAKRQDGNWAQLSGAPRIEVVRLDGSGWPSCAETSHSRFGERALR
jgi:hypothetical protein